MAWCALPDGTKEFLNKQWHDYMGLPPEESDGWGWTACVHPDDLSRLLKDWQAMMASGEQGETEARLRRRDGTFRWFLIRGQPLRDATGKIVRWYGTTTDIENLKQTEAKLREDEREFRRITDAIPQNIIVLDLDGVPLYANQTTLDFTGLTLREILAPDFRQRVFHPDDLEINRVARSTGLAQGAPFEIEQRALRHDGDYRWFLIRYNPFRSEQGQVIRWYATGTDIQDRKSAEDRMRNENTALREEIVRSSMLEEIVGSSAAIREVLEQVAKVAPTDSTVLIHGETGTGKELIARAIHNGSQRANRAFIRVNCAAIPQGLIASELFGHEQGAFTGALQRRMGRFEAAEGGTILLDEVGELPLETQAALLRVLQDHEFERVGGNQSISVDVRVLVATYKDLAAATDDGTFRKDLFYRLNIFPICLPALRNRAGDIPLLVEYLVERYALKGRKKIRSISKDTLALFQNYQWPGNIRELQNVIERAVILSDSETFSVNASWLASLTPGSASKALPLASDLARREKTMIENALREAQGKLSGPAGAAAKLGLPRQTLESKIKKLGIKRYRFKIS
jgi:formate hydrogenlyase transcriptional activator